jgi:lysophospholipase L1-like esterase
MAWNPKNINSVCYIRSWEGVTVLNSNVTAVSDLSVNGNNFALIGVPVISPDANAFNSIKFNTSTSLTKSFPVNGLLSTNKKAGWIVYKSEDGKYHNLIFMYNKIVPEQNYIINNANNFTHIVQLTSLDTASSKGIGINVNSQEINVSQWGTNGNKMTLCEFGLINEDLNPLTVSTINNLKAYFKNNYADISESQQEVTVYNDGYNGDNTSDIIARLSTINSHNANLAIVMIGYNDWRHPNIIKRRTPAQYKTNLTTIVTSLKANGSAVLLVNFPRIEPTESDYVCAFYGELTGCNSNATSNDFRTKITEVVSEQSIMYFDLMQKFVDVGQPNYTNSSYCRNIINSASADGLHFTPTGALFCAQKIKEYLNLNSLSYIKISCIGDSQTAGDGLTGLGTATGQTYPAQLKLLLNP